jgi:hypothetical protein
VLLFDISVSVSTKSEKMLTILLSFEHFKKADPLGIILTALTPHINGSEF